MSALFGTPRSDMSTIHVSPAPSNFSSSNISTTPLTSKKRVERRTAKIRDLEEHLRKGGVSFPFGAARAIVDNDYDCMDDLLRLDKEQLVQLLIMAGLRETKTKGQHVPEDSFIKSLKLGEGKGSMFETPKHGGTSLRDLSNEMSVAKGDDNLGQSFYEMEKKYSIGPEGLMPNELPLDTFTEVTNSLNVLMLHAKKSYDEAEDEYRSALRTNESFEWAHNNLGMLLMNVRNDYDGAEREFRRAIELDSTYAWPRNNLGLLLFEIREEYAAAEMEFRACIDLDPGHREAHSNLATLLNAKAMKLELKRDAGTAAAIYMEAADHWEHRHGKHNNYSREARAKAAHLMGVNN